MSASMRCTPTRLRCLRRELAARLAAQDGSFLVEGIVASVIVLITGLGILAVIDRSSQLSGQQRTQAVAGNVAQAEQETLRSLPLTQLSNLRRSTTRTVATVPYSIASRADWVDDANGDASCASADSSADYLKISTTVTWPSIGSRSPITLDSLIAPPARSFGSNQGSLAVQVNDRLGAGLSGLTLSLSGPATLSDATNTNGCVLWGYLAAGGGYTIDASRAGYVEPDGSTTISEPATVAGDATTNVTVQYDQAGGIRTNFTTQRPAGAVMVTKPQTARVEISNPGFVPKSFPVSADRLDTGLALFPFSSPYSVYADSCAAAKPPSPATVTVAPGVSTASADLRLPSLNIKVTSNGTPQVGAVVRVVSPCGTVYRRSTIAGGLVDDPGFPYGTGLAVCVSNGTRKREIASQANTAFPGTNLTLDVGTSGSALGTCPSP